MTAAFMYLAGRRWAGLGPDRQRLLGGVPALDVDGVRERLRLRRGRLLASCGALGMAVLIEVPI